MPCCCLYSIPRRGIRTVKIYFAERLPFFKNMFLLLLASYMSQYVCTPTKPELQIRGGIEDNSKIIFLISQ